MEEKSNSISSSIDFNEHNLTQTQIQNENISLNSSLSIQEDSSLNQNEDTTKNSSFLTLSTDINHPIEEVNTLIEEFKYIKNRPQDYLSTEEHENDIVRLEFLSEKLLVFANDDSSLLIYVNQIDQLKDLKNYLKTKESKHFATYNRFTDNQIEHDENGNLIMSTTFINKLLCTNGNLYYRTHELNDILYLHFKGFRRIDNLSTFINLKVLYLESNCITEIQGLDCLVNLTGLYLQENMIQRISNLNTLVHLNTLNLSDNRIHSIENLEFNKRLSTLLLKRNFIGTEVNDLQGLLFLPPSVSVIDLSENRIEYDQIIEHFLTKVPGLKVLYLHGNDCTRRIAYYRKTMIYKIKQLKYLDDKPVFEDERLFSEAFGRGGLEEERRERERYRQEKKEEQLRRVYEFQEMVDGWKKKTKEEGVVKVDEDKENVDSNTRSNQKLDMLVKMNNKMKEAKKEKEEKEENGSVPILESVDIKNSHVSNSIFDECD